MKTIHISANCYEQIQGKNVDYFISEMLGIVEYKAASTLKVFSHIDKENQGIPIEITNDTYEQLTQKFKLLDNVDDISELLIWAYLLIGRNI